MVVSKFSALLIVLFPILGGMLFVLLRMLVKKEFKAYTLLAFFGGIIVTILLLMTQTKVIIVQQGAVDKLVVFGSATVEGPDGQTVDVEMNFAMRRCYLINSTGLDVVIDHIFYQSVAIGTRGYSEPDVPASIDIPAHSKRRLAGWPDYWPGELPPEEIELNNRYGGKGETKTWLHFADGAPPIY